MKKAKRILMVVCSLLLVFVLTGCGNKTPLTAEQFKSKMEGNSYTVTDVSSILKESTDAVSVFTATSKDSNIIVEFLVFDKEDDATKFYNELKEQLEKEKGSSSSNTEVNLGNYNKYTQNSNDAYGIVERVEKTVILIETKEENKKDADSLLDSLGY